MRKTIPVLFCVMVMAFAVLIALPMMAVEVEKTQAYNSINARTETKANLVNLTSGAENVLTRDCVEINATAIADGLFANTSNTMNEVKARVDARKTTANANIAVKAKIMSDSVLTHLKLESAVMSGLVDESAEHSHLALVTKNAKAKRTGNGAAESTMDTAMVLKRMMNTGQIVPAPDHDYQFS